MDVLRVGAFEAFLLSHGASPNRSGAIVRVAGPGSQAVLGVVNEKGPTPVISGAVANAKPIVGCRDGIEGRERAVEETAIENEEMVIDEVVDIEIDWKIGVSCSG